MKRIHYLAAEIFSYSYDNYEGHLGINARFDEVMPRDARLLELGVDGKVELKEVAARLEIDEDVALDLLRRTQRARRVVDAENPAEAFREGVRQSIELALEKGLEDPAALDSLVVQICYRAADLGFLLKEAGQALHDHSEQLRRED